MINYPTALDNDTNLYLVHDSLKAKLAEDYNPGDTSIIVDSDLSKFPPTGIISLTEQCSDIESRAISFEYSSRADNTFSGLVLIGDIDIAKPKRLTHVALNVVADHHNVIKDALIAVEEFSGVKGEIANSPLTGTVEARINFLRDMVLKPKSWFSVQTKVGVVPFEVSFQDLSLRAPTKYEWDFGDGDDETLTFDLVPGEAEGTASTYPDGSTTHTYTVPGIYDVTLTTTNSFGTNTVVFPNFINARTSAPDEAEIDFSPSPTQIVSGDVIRSKINIPIQINVTDNGEQAGDDITRYTWELSDDLQHPNLPLAEAQYSIGGIYDAKLRVDTELGAYRTSIFSGVLDIVEKQNIWITVFDPDAPDDAITKDAYTYEFGLLSETFKIKSNNPLSITRDYSFLSDPGLDQQKEEFLRNNGFTPRSLTSSGDRGTAVMYWSSGASDPYQSQTINFREFNGFTDTYTTPSLGTLTRDWNWVSLNATSSIYFLFGTQWQGGEALDLTNSNMQEVSLGTFTAAGKTLNANNFENGAEELLSNVGDGDDGQFSVYRSCWKDSTGYIARNDGTGSFFRIKSFYRTEGILSDPVRHLRKLPDIPGATKANGQLVALSGGVYFFNNTGEVSVYDTIGNVWASGGPGLNSPAFNTLQDSSVSGFDNGSNSLIATSDGDRNAYLSFDYSPNVFIKFNEIDLTFTKLPNRPIGEQFGMVCY